MKWSWVQPLFRRISFCICKQRAQIPTSGMLSASSEHFTEGVFEAPIKEQRTGTSLSLQSNYISHLGPAC